MMPSEYYSKKLNELTNSLKLLLQKKSRFGFLRLGTLALVVASFYFLWSVQMILAIIIAVVLVGIFLKLIHSDIANRNAIKHVEFQIQINKNELLALDGMYYQFKNGNEFSEANHLYANDMDILGHASLFQFLNRTTSEFGAEKLANWLLHPTDKNTILKRQDAVKNLTKTSDWNQHFLATGKESNIKKSTLFKLENWLKQSPIFTKFKHLKWLRYVMPAITLTIFTMYAFDIVGDNYFYITLLISGIINFQINKLVTPLHNQLSDLVNDLETLSNSLALIEKQNFESDLLNELKSTLTTKNLASQKIKVLKVILDRLDLRFNIVISIPLNLILFWSLQQILDLEKWKKENTDNITTWFDTLSEMEALQSFATIAFNNPDWAYPTLADDYFKIEAANLGHPLISKAKRINNLIDLQKADTVMLITGSNMAGKSTYLRSVGVNAVLCMAGAAVCASTFEMSPAQILSSMRVADNLEENTSTFYAELKKLKTIIEKMNAGEKVFILLDEILRGTNSLDRHTGTDALIRQLIKLKTPAILATHDVELAKIETEFSSNIFNHHFDAQINGEELYFDYKLKNGVCTNLNASLLMKKIGLSL